MQLNEVIELFRQKCNDKFLEDVSYLFSLCESSRKTIRDKFFLCLCYVYYMYISNEFDIDIYSFDSLYLLSRLINSKNTKEWQLSVNDSISTKNYIFSVTEFNIDEKNFEECREEYQKCDTNTLDNLSIVDNSKIEDKIECRASESITSESNDITLNDMILDPKPYQRFDTSKVWKRVYDDCGRPMNMYATLPTIPKVQRDISVTTDVDKMSTSELLNLYPKSNPIKGFRSHPMFRKTYKGFKNDPILGFIPKILNFTEQQIIDNIIKYPSVSSTCRLDISPDTGRCDFKRPFYEKIEIDGELLECRSIEQVKDYVPDIQDMYDAGITELPILWDYIVRRYLLERDILGIHHKSQMYGDLQPFACLCLPSFEYVNRGYTDDIEEFAYNHVKTRIHYLESINAVIRGYDVNSKSVLTNDTHQCMYSNVCTESHCDFTCRKGNTCHLFIKESNFKLYSSVFMNYYTDQDFQKFGNIIKSCRRTYGVIMSKGRKYLTDAFFYAAMNVERNRLSYWSDAFLLNYRKYIDAYKRSWTTGEEPFELRRSRYNAENCSTLIIHGLDTMIFGDYESQTLLALFEDRNKARQSTIVIMSDVNNINTSSHSTTTFVKILREELRKRVLTC